MNNPIEKRKITLQIDMRLSEFKRLSRDIKRKYKLISDYILEQRKSKKDSKEEVKRKIDEYCSMHSEYMNKKKTIFKEIVELTSKKYGNQNE